jgi:staphylococcal nuclease domain-containing protein 1
LKAIVEYVFNGSRFKLYVPSENCHIVFAPNYLRCPQPSPMPGSRQVKPAEPFGDASKRHARLTVLQRTVDINCTGVTNGGVITGDMFVGQGGQRRNYSLELVGAGLATLDERKLEYGEVPKMLMDAMAAAQKNRVGIWSIEQKTDDKKTVQVATKSKAEVIKVTISEIRSGSHFFYQLVGDKSAKVVDDSMKKFTKDNGTAGAPCDVKPGKVVAALFDDGTGKSWYRAKILTRGERGKVQVLFVDHGNVAAVPLASHLRPLDITLGTDRIPAVAHEAELALTLTRPISDDEGLEAARMLQKLAWGKELIATKYCDLEGKAQVALKDLEAASSINEQLVSAGLARVAKQPAVNVLSSRMLDGNELTEFAAELNVAQDAARKFRSGMWRYGDIGDEDDEE